MRVRPAPAGAPASRPAATVPFRSPRLGGIRAELVADLEVRARSRRTPGPLEEPLEGPSDGTERRGASDLAARRAGPERRDGSEGPVPSADPEPPADGPRPADVSGAPEAEAPERPTRPGSRSIVPTVVDGWRRRGRPVDLVLDEPAAPVPVRRSLGGTPSFWFRRETDDAGADAGTAPTGADPGKTAPVPTPAPTDARAEGLDQGGNGPAAPDAGAPEPVRRDVVPEPGSTSGALAARSPTLPVTPAELVEPAEGPIVARDPTELGPSLPRRAGSLVRRWVTRVVSFVRRLPAKLGFGRGCEDEGAGEGKDEGKR